MSSTCNNDNIFIGKLSSPTGKSGKGTSINIEGVDPIIVTKHIEGDVTTFIIEYKPYVSPKATLTVSPSSVEAGQSFNATYTSTWVKGSHDIVSVDLSGTALSVSPDTLTVNGLIYNTTGTYGGKTLTVTDSKGEVVSAFASITVNKRYYVGTKPRNTDNSTIVKDTGVLSSSMSAAYGSLRSYLIPDTDSHIVWLVPQGESMGTVKDENNFECETINNGEVSITNTHGVTSTYTVIMSKNFYASGNTLNLKF